MLSGKAKKALVREQSIPSYFRRNRSFPELTGRITKELYPGIARRFGTTSSKVERAIRYAIEVAWNRGRVEALDEAFGKNVCSLEDKPTNGEFIALVADRLSMKESA